MVLWRYGTYKIINEIRGRNDNVSKVICRTARMRYQFCRVFKKVKKNEGIDEKVNDG